eukprot:CAMPEP_0173398214 /NCGR_PEP_ID=MMETSP1356-20130122/40857_1 /TAXON_ID=77927 ORGANISM="Hemiselmis virescens, Strain PCC157" /NCGR_SAMPLE_ID=MMETSP1356 /ASSEMBLY_ACC=CAM_ASM_000847 /LENGTH=145 /DNA_ID=CAMNT_0014357653 /DNA_START=107 /DNA_END=541 /DNA_ORIENTATION=+
MAVLSPLDAARGWLSSKGWEAANYHIAVAEVQSCPDGYTSVDVTCINLEESEDYTDLLKRSRVLEVSNETGDVETVLAARDMARLKRMLELETVRVHTESLQEQLEYHHSHDAPAERDATVEELLLEQDPEKRLAEVQAEIDRIR